MLIYLDGDFLKLSKEEILSLSPGVLRAQGVFETMFIKDGHIYDLPEHLKRLQKGLKALGLNWMCSSLEVERIVHQLLLANRVRISRFRVCVWKDRKNIRVSMVCLAYKPLSQTDYRKGFSVILSKVRCNKTEYSHLKTLDYFPQRCAFLEAQKNGCDEAILLNNHQDVVEGSRSNIFMVRDGVLYTPHLSCGCLEGITRAKIIKLAKKLQVRCVAKRLSLKDIVAADEVFFTNSLIGIMPLTKFKERKILRYNLGPVTQKLTGLLR